MTPGAGAGGGGGRGERGEGQSFEETRAPFGEDPKLLFAVVPPRGQMCVAREISFLLVTWGLRLGPLRYCSDWYVPSGHQH